MTETGALASGTWLHPSLLLILGTLVIPFLRGRVQQGYRLLLSLVFLWVVWTIAPGTYGSLQFLGLDLVPGRVDTLSLVFAYVFSLITVIGTIYSLHLKDNVQHVAALIYAAAAVGVVFAGDLVTLYVFWELMMLASVWLIWRRRTPQSYAAGMRYLLVHTASGVMLLGGIALFYTQTGSIAFEQIDITGPAFYLILIGFMINAAVPPLHAWLSDAYPEATVTGAIFLSALTTKTAVYVLIRGFPGTELLVWMGAVMALWGVVYAVLANDIRRLLAYHIISQVGYMVAGVGMGTAIALNGSASHAFTHILYKALLFMGAGAVIHMTGKSKLTELGGLYRYMPYTFLLYMIGAFSISAFPLFSGFVSKTMVVEAAAVDYRMWIWLMLSMASAGTFLHTGLKLPYFTFLGRDSGLRPQEAPWNMLLAMGIAAFFCVFIGVYPAWLYGFLPAPVDYNAYTLDHLFWELQLLLFTGLGFFLLLKHVGGEPKISIDTDWLYRRALPATARWVGDRGGAAWQGLLTLSRRSIAAFVTGLARHHGPGSVLARTWPTGSMVLWVAIILAGSLLIYYV
ncbi:MAG: Na(+)/H(+) antiporter subunit D [Thioalkalivibrio sp.]|nr:Na(+)/H(+) antiporter subunit D [Thioalkalivibrio sp.]